MEVMEDGNLMDKVHILIQRDMDYYREKQSILQEVICPAIVGGRLDFPRFVSFASMKLVLWWEEEYIAAYRKGSGFLQKPLGQFDDDYGASGGCGGVVKASDPLKFVQSVHSSAKDLLDHLHVLTQEALDHADLTVLTGTIGATSLLKNCLWFYIQSMGETKNNHVQILQDSLKKYQEMEEALAERLLDLHCRLLSLYILQDSDCLAWETETPFFELERGSFVIQMWWLYLKGTRENLWNTVPPKMAQRVFVGMLNESLTILTVRYTQATPSRERTSLLIVDLSNLLLCIAQLLPSVCDNAEEYMGIDLNNKTKILRDIHAKCQELLFCLMLRGAPLDVLHRVFRSGVEKVELFKCKNSGPSPWVLFSLPNIFQHFPRNLLNICDFSEDIAITLELLVLLAQPQPFWSLLVKALGMRGCRLIKLIMQLCVTKSQEEIKMTKISRESCVGFLCASDGQCMDVDKSVFCFTSSHYYDLFRATTDVLVTVGNSEEITKILLESIINLPNWAKCLDRRNVWNQIKPAWYLSVMDLAKPILPKIMTTTINAIKTGASMYQAMAIILACFSYFWDCLESTLFRITNMIQEILPSEIVPLGHSVLLQTLISALYTELLKHSNEKILSNTAKLPDSPRRPPQNTFDGTQSSDNEIALALAEALCSIDEDNKHTDQIDEFLQQTRKNVVYTDFDQKGSARLEACAQMCENLISDLLTTDHGKQNLKILYHFIKNNQDWIFQELGMVEKDTTLIPNKIHRAEESLLFTMFHIGKRPFDQVLTGEWQPDWMSLLRTAMGLSTEKVVAHINQRWEFRDINSLTTHDIQVMNNISAIMKSII